MTEPHFTQAHMDMSPPDNYSDPNYLEDLRTYLIRNFKILRSAALMREDIMFSNLVVENTAVETDILSASFANNAFIKGQFLNALLAASYSNASASDDFTVRLYLNGSLLASVARVGGNSTDAAWVCDFGFSVRSVGVAGSVMSYKKVFDGVLTVADVDKTAITIDTTATALLRVTVQWDNAKAGNIFTLSNAQLLMNYYGDR